MVERQQRNNVDLWLGGGFVAASLVSAGSFVSLLLAGTEQASAYWGLVFGLPILVVALCLGWAVVSTSRPAVREVLPPFWFEAGDAAGVAQKGEGDVITRADENRSAGTAAANRGDTTPPRGYAATTPR